MPNKATSTKACFEVEIPQEFICPLTLEVMADPVVNKHNQAYERCAIIEWVGEHGTCPLTRSPCRVTDFFTYHQLRLKIEAFQLAYDLPSSASTDEPNSSMCNQTGRGNAYQCVKLFLNFSEDDRKKIAQRAQRRNESVGGRKTCSRSSIPVVALSSEQPPRLHAPRIVRLRA